MSYEIVYDKQFIKLPNNNYIPLLFWGSNNCTEWSPNGGERRARSWSPYTYHCGNKLFNTEENILNSVEQFRNSIKDSNQDDYSDKNFGFWSSIAIGSKGTHRTTYGMYKGMFKTGIKKALTVEELLDFNVHVTLESYSYEDVYSEFNVPKTYERPKSSEELYNAIKVAENTYKNIKGISLILSINASEFDMKLIRKTKFPRSKKIDNRTLTAKVDGYWTYIAPNEAYFHKFTSKGYIYSYYTPKYKFLTEEEANAKLSSERKKRGIITKYVNEETYLSVSEEELNKINLIEV